MNSPSESSRNHPRAGNAGIVVTNQGEVVANGLKRRYSKRVDPLGRAVSKGLNFENPLAAGNCESFVAPTETGASKANVRGLLHFSYGQTLHAQFPRFR